MSAAKKRPSPIVLCDKCDSYVLNKDSEVHSNESCPPKTQEFSYPFIRNNVFHGVLETKTSADDNLPNYKDSLVFLSHSVMQLCDYALGDKVFITNIESNLTFERAVWHSNEKCAMSIQFTKKGLETSFMKSNINVSVSKLQNSSKKAKSINLVCLNSNIVELGSNLIKIIHRNYKNSFLRTNLKITVLFYGKLLKFEVQDIEDLEQREDQHIESYLEKLTIDDVFYQVTDKTKWTVLSKDDNLIKNKRKLISTIGGLDDTILEVKRLMNIALGKMKGISNCQVTRGVLFYGLSGTGKTLLAKALAEESDAHIINLSFSEEYDQIEKENKYKISEEAIKNAPTIIIIDNCEEFCPAITSRSSILEKKMNERMSLLFEDLESSFNSRVFILATTSKIDLIDSRFLQCGRLQPEIEIAIPNFKGRLDIMRKLLNEEPNNISEGELENIAGFTNGFVGRDLLSLYGIAVRNAEQLHSTQISWQDFEAASKLVKPSLVRGVQIKVPNVKWSDIGGQRELKQILRQSIEGSLKDREGLQRLGLSPIRGVLMYGPPGCSKTMIAKAMATESGLIFLTVGPEVFNKWVGESERNIREVFRIARQVAPSVIFFDEIDAIGSKRNSGSTSNVQDRVLTQLLTELDGIKALGDVIVLAATNRPDRIDRALLRPGRFDKIVYVPLPDTNTRKEIFQLKMNKMPVSGVDLNYLVEKTNNYSGAEINEICNTAASKAYEEDPKIEKIESRHFDFALDKVIPRTPLSLIKIYENYSSTSIIDELNNTMLCD